MDFGSLAIYQASTNHNVLVVGIASVCAGYAKTHLASAGPRMSFVLSSAEIDAVAAGAKNPEPHEIAAIFRHQTELEENGTRGTAWVLLADLMDMHFEPRKERQPFGPIWRISDRRSMIPDDLVEDAAAAIRSIVPEIKSAPVRARLADIVWLRLRDPATARIAVAAYMEFARVQEDPNDWTVAMFNMERAIRLSRALGKDDESFTPVIAYLRDIADRHQGEDPLFLTGKALELLLEFDAVDANSGIQYASTAADRACAAGNFDVARFYFGLTAKLQAHQNNAPGRNAALVGIARTYEAQAERHEQTKQYVAAVSFWHRAIEAHRRVTGGGAAVEALRPRLRRAENLAVPQFGRASAEVNIGPLVEAARKSVAGHGKLDAIHRFVGISPLADVNKVRETALELARRFPLQSLIGGAVVDREGRIIGKRPPLPLGEGAVDEEAVFARMVEQMNMQRGLIVQAQIGPAYNQIANEHTITWNDIAEIVIHTPFVPEGREAIFADGLYAGFQHDFVTATHLLVPQIENSLRHLMRMRGMVTTALDQNGIQREIDLNALVVDPRVEEIVSTRVIFELRSLFTDARGPNLRNQLAHGMIDHAGFFSTNAIYAWWLVLVLCLQIHPTQPSVAEPTPGATSASDPSDLSSG